MSQTNDTRGSEQLDPEIVDDLESLDMVQWDRFTVGEDPDRGRAVSVYGWIDREDEYKDFAIVIFYPDTEDGLIYYTTSSDEWTHEIGHRLFGVDREDGHNGCLRVEDFTDIPNAVEIKQRDYYETEHRLPDELTGSDHE